MTQRIGAFIHSEEIERFHYPADCPFKTERASMTRSILRSMGLYNGAGSSEIAPRPATQKELTSFHEPAYLAALRRISRGDFRSGDFSLGLGTPDTPVFTDLYPYSELAAGGTVAGAEMILHGGVDYVFNPSGGFHHALPATAGGFCYINDVVIACKMLAAQKKRVFCLDLDAHHGNGTQAAFYTDPSVMTVSFHESGKSLYPFSGFENEIGEGGGFGYNVNLPLPPETDDESFVNAFGAVVPPLLDAYRPDVIVLEIGMDILSVDPLTHLSMTNNAVADVLPRLIERHIPMLVVGGGGYSAQDTARGWALLWTILTDNEPDMSAAIGMGGVFLGSTEWGAGLRDMKIYATGESKASIRAEIDRSIRLIRRTVFPIHGISAEQRHDTA